MSGNKTICFVKRIMFLDVLKSILFCGLEQHWNRMRPAHFWKERRGTSLFSKGLQKIVKKRWKINLFREELFFVGLRSSPSLFIPNNSRNPPPGTPPGRSLFYFFGRWMCTRYSEIVPFSIWGTSGGRVGRARAGAFSGTLARPFFAKPWGDFDGNPQLILTIPFWSLFENRPFLGKKRVFGGSLLVVLGRWNCTRSNEIVTFSFLERLKIERSSLALQKKRKSENSNIS